MPSATGCGRSSTRAPRPRSGGAWGTTCGDPSAGPARPPQGSRRWTTRRRPPWLHRVRWTRQAPVASMPRLAHGPPPRSSSSPRRAARPSRPPGAKRHGRVLPRWLTRRVDALEPHQERSQQVAERRRAPRRTGLLDTCRCIEVHTHPEDHEHHRARRGSGSRRGSRPPCDRRAEVVRPLARDGHPRDLADRARHRRAGQQRDQTGPLGLQRGPEHDRHEQRPSLDVLPGAVEPAAPRRLVAAATQRPSGRRRPPSTAPPRWWNR